MLALRPEKTLPFSVCSANQVSTTYCLELTVQLQLWAEKGTINHHHQPCNTLEHIIVMTSANAATREAGSDSIRLHYIPYFSDFSNFGYTFR